MHKISHASLRKHRIKLLILAAILIVIILGAFVWQTQQKKTLSFMLAWGSKGSDNGQFNGPGGVAVDSAGNVYVADWVNNRVQKFTSDGRYVTQWGSVGSGPGQFHNPSGIAVDSFGNVYVTDYGNYRVQKFDSSGTYITQWGSRGSGAGQFEYPQGVAVDSSGSVYVIDEGRVEKFTSNEAYITQWRSAGPGLAVDSSGNVYVADPFNHRVEKFTSSGSFITAWGSRGPGPGQFDNPRGIAVDSFGNVYVADFGNNRVQEFTSTGTYITQWRSEGSGNSQFGAYGPHGIAVDSSGNVYITDYWNNRIEKFGSVATIPVEQLVLVIGIAVGALAFIILKRPTKTDKRLKPNFTHIVRRLRIRKHQIKLVLAVIFIATLLGAYAYQQYRSQPTTKITALTTKIGSPGGFPGFVNVTVVYSGGHNLIVGILDPSTGDYAPASLWWWSSPDSNCSSRTDTMYYGYREAICSADSGTVSVQFEIRVPSLAYFSGHKSQEWNLKAIASLADQDFNPIKLSASEYVFTFRFCDLNPALPVCASYNR
jgi:streptogramin lyase